MMGPLEAVQYCTPVPPGSEHNTEQLDGKKGHACNCTANNHHTSCKQPPRCGGALRPPTHTCSARAPQPVAPQCTRVIRAVCSFCVRHQCSSTERGSVLEWLRGSPAVSGGGAVPGTAGCCCTHVRLCVEVLAWQRRKGVGWRAWCLAVVLCTSAMHAAPGCLPLHSAIK